MVQHLDRPFHGTYPVTQGYANLNALEPLGWLYADGGIGYVEQQGAIQGHYHNGTDYGLPCSTQLIACANGTVSFAGFDSTGFGWRVSVDHGNGLQTLVGHMSEIIVHVGQQVTAGQEVGLSGTSGNSTGCHTHWSVQQGAEYVNPLPYLNAPVPAPLPTASHYLIKTPQALRAKPDASSAHTSDVLPVGTKLTALSGWTLHWREVQTDDNHAGWALAENLSGVA